MWIYSQSSGKFEGENLSAICYSGNGLGLNNPAMQAAHDVGPIPQGVYTIEPPHADQKVGPVAMRLVPAAGNQMFGRGDFLIHGDNAALDHTASEGCIIMDRMDRVLLGEAVMVGDNQLTVTA